MADLTDAEAVARTAAQATDTFGGVDVLVNNAGTPGPLGPLWTIDEPDWWRTLEVNVRGSWLFTREVVPGMINRGSGRIITIVSPRRATPLAIRQRVLDFQIRAYRADRESRRRVA